MKTLTIEDSKELLDKIIDDILEVYGDDWDSSDAFCDEELLDYVDGQHWEDNVIEGIVWYHHYFETGFNAYKYIEQRVENFYKEKENK